MMGEGRPPMPFLKIEKNVLVFPSRVFEKMFMEVPQFHKPLPFPSLALENFWLPPCNQALFLQNTSS